MEETIRVLQACEARPDVSYGDCILFPGMRLPSKVKIPEFRTYEGTTDLRHHLRHYHGKMLQYWDHEEFVIHSFQDSLSGFVLDWFMSLKAEDILTWADLSRKFIDQGVYYSHLLVHTSSFSDLIEAGKKLNLGIKPAGWRAPTSKKEDSSKKAPATTTPSSGRRGKEVSVNAVNPAHPTPQQYSMNFTSAPPVVPPYAPHAPQYRPQPPTQPIYYSALPPSPPSTIPSPVVHHYVPTPLQTPQYQPPAPRVSQPMQRVPTPQGQQGDAAQPRPRRQYPSLPVPLAHIYRQLRASD
ncbi:hypothetical protein CRG98_014074 [Punica granatum]|uniref:Retrotransposon gag domain-containing protein n=1 Tax=Punica granatum TaxID=22663 RepID=A0A2I0KAL5_PUNGR|nr:hypothetical protein CRG98_014074 [Punica granatum]